MGEWRMAEESNPIPCGIPGFLDRSPATRRRHPLAEGEGIELSLGLAQATA